MLPIRDQAGKTCGWLNDRHVHDLTGQHFGYVVSHGHVFTFMGAYVGRLDDGYFCDRAGDAVAWLDGASGGPPLPAALPTPIAPTPQAPLIDFPPLPHPPVPSTPTHKWSSLTWDRFCTGTIPSDLAEVEHEKTGN